MRFHSTRPRADHLLLPALFLASPALAQRTTAAAPPAAPTADEEDEPVNTPANTPAPNPAPTNAGPPTLEEPKPNASTPAAAPPVNTNTNKPAPTVEVPQTKTPDNAPAPTNTPSPADDTPTPTSPSNEKPLETTVAKQPAFTVTGSASGTNTVSAPLADATITGGSDATSGGLKGAPKLPPTGVPIPVPQVPPTRGAPYMQESSLPAGTVFIAVGAILGFFFICVLLWRGLTVWALKRNMKRAAERQKAGGAGGGDTKQLLNFRKPDIPMAGYRDGNRDSMLSLGRMPGGTRTPGRSGRPQTASSTQGHASTLFFSPTAQGAGGVQSNRGSTYLPSGYYAAGSAAPGNGAGMTHLGGNISLSNLGGPPTQGYSRARSLIGETPPDSPRSRAMGDRLAPGGTGGNFSTSTLDLNQRPAGRAPSAYLEDLFDEAGATPGNYPLNDIRHPGHPNYNGGRI